MSKRNIENEFNLMISGPIGKRVKYVTENQLMELSDKFDFNIQFYNGVPLEVIVTPNGSGYKLHTAKL